MLGRLLMADAGATSVPILRVGQVYTRAELRELFSITDATINSGVFPVKDRSEIWLFVTEQKQADQVQYEDELIGDELRWQGQSTGRTDARIINHRSEANELLVFYRKAKRQFPGAGFRFEGRFDYVKHWGTGPTSFVLKRSRSSTG
jgi:hypothetical protein